MTCHNILRDNDLNAVPLPSKIKNVEYIKFLQNCAPVCALIFFFFFFSCVSFFFVCFISSSPSYFQRD